MNSQTISELSTTLLPLFKSVLEKENLENDLLKQFKTLYLPLAGWIANKHFKEPVIIGINGAQGAGKSTLSLIIDSLLTHGFNKSVLRLSLDDLYLSQKKRTQLALDIHPLFKTRGVPGTHDVTLGINILSKLQQKQQLIQAVSIPVFDKAIDDVLPDKDWRKVDKNIDIILFEGWCVGAKAQQESALSTAMNELEEFEDTQGVWRAYINQQLQGSYKTLFKLIDYQIMLKVPDMASVFEWRRLQEKKLALSCKKNHLSNTHIMSEKELIRFIMFFERITRDCLQDLPATADIVLGLNQEHQVNDVKFNDKKINR